jgi:hypothetical protein
MTKLNGAAGPDRTIKRSPLTCARHCRRCYDRTDRAGGRLMRATIDRKETEATGEVPPPSPALACRFASLFTGARAVRWEPQMQRGKRAPADQRTLGKVAVQSQRCLPPHDGREGHRCRAWHCLISARRRPSMNKYLLSRPEAEVDCSGAAHIYRRDPCSPGFVGMDL